MNQSKHQATFGIDLGGTTVRVGLFDSHMKLLGRHTMRTRTEHGPDAVVGDMVGAIENLQARHGAGLQMEGIGIGSPGPLNLRTGALALLPNFPGWDGYPLRDRLALATGLPVTLDCDANAAALAEWRFGAGAQYAVHSMAMITLGTGVGSGIVLKGEVWNGQIGMGGEVGHVTVDPDGPRCTCGSRGCLELYASANGVKRLALQHAGQNSSSALGLLVHQVAGFTPLQIAQLALAGDVDARAVFAQLGHYLGLGLAGLQNTLDLPLMVIGGGLAGAWSLFVQSMFATLREYSYVYRLRQPAQLDTFEPDRTHICAALLGEDAGLLGAGLLARSGPALASSTSTIPFEPSHLSAASGESLHD